jgi:hypothetical protein
LLLCVHLIFILEHTEPFLTFKDLGRPMIDVLHEHNLVTPALQAVIKAAKVTTVQSLCLLEVWYFSFTPDSMN